MSTQDTDVETDTVAIPKDVKGRTTLRDLGISLAEATEAHEETSPQLGKVAPNIAEADTAAETVLAEVYRETTFDASSDLLAGREKVTGPQVVQLAKIAQVWSTIFGRRFTPADVSLALSATHLVSLSTNNNQGDQWAEMTAAAALGSEAAHEGK